MIYNFIFVLRVFFLLKEYLRTYGYIPSESNEIGKLVSEDTIKNGLSRFQKNMGLPVTGTRFRMMFLHLFIIYLLILFLIYLLILFIIYLIKYG